MVCSALLGLGSQAPPLPHCILPYGADARVHAEHGVPGTRSCGLFCLSAERQLALSGLAPFAALCAAPAERQLALSGLAPFAALCAAPAERQLALSGLAPFAALCAAPAERQLALSGLAPFRPRAAPAERQLCHLALSALLRHQRSFSSASRGWQPLLPIHGTTAARGSGGATALPHLVQAPGTECALQLARCASGYDGDLHRALPFVGHWCPDFAPPVCMPARRGASCPRRPSAVAAAHRGIPGVTVLYGVACRFTRPLCPLSGCASAPYSGSSDRCMGPLRMA